MSLFTKGVGRPAGSSAPGQKFTAEERFAKALTEGGPATIVAETQPGAPPLAASATVDKQSRRRRLDIRRSKGGSALASASSIVEMMDAQLLEGSPVSRELMISVVEALDRHRGSARADAAIELLKSCIASIDFVSDRRQHMISSKTAMRGRRIAEKPTERS